jgi:hypothetical protein
MKAISDDRIEATLCVDGLEPGDYFILNGMPMFWSRLGGVICPWARVIEIDSLADACVEYLRRHGVKEYADLSEVPKPADK